MDIECRESPISIDSDEYQFDATKNLKCRESPISVESDNMPQFNLEEKQSLPFNEKSFKEWLCSPISIIEMIIEKTLSMVNKTFPSFEEIDWARSRFDSGEECQVMKIGPYGFNSPGRFMFHISNINMNDIDPDMIYDMLGNCILEVCEKEFRIIDSSITIPIDCSYIGFGWTI